MVVKNSGARLATKLSRSWTKTGMTGLTSNWVRLAQNGKKPGPFQIRFQVSVHFGSPSQNVLKLILKSATFVPFQTNLTQFGVNPDIPALYITADSCYVMVDIKCGAVAARRGFAAFCDIIFRLCRAGRYSDCVELEDNKTVSSWSYKRTTFQLLVTALGVRSWRLCEVIHLSNVSSSTYLLYSQWIKVYLNKQSVQLDSNYITYVIFHCVSNLN